MAFRMCLFSLLLVIDGLSLCLTAPAPDCANTVFNVFTAGNKHVKSSGNEENYNDGQTKQMVAFSVATKKSDIGAAIYSTVKFDEIGNNRQNAFNLATNVFTAPVSGVYFFSFTGRAHGNNIYAYLNVNSNRRFTTILSPSISTGGFSNVVELDAGAKVFMSRNPNHKLLGCTPPCTTFSGYLVHPSSTRGQSSP